ncbi:MAG: FGGY-family carbohydrate kinase, partial [Ginsengibacter sp.]
ASGVFIGIKSYHQQAHFLRAGLEGVSFVLKSILQVIEQTTGSIRQLNVSGGFTHSQSWVQILADVTGKKVCLIQTEDASAVGAALLSMKALKVIENFSSLRSDEGTIISPLKENSAMYEKYFSVFKDLYPILKDTLHLIATVEK